MSNNHTFSGKQVLVTGASGFIGKKLCERLKQLDVKTYGVSTRSREKSAVIDEWVVGDLSDPAFAKLAVEKSDPNILFHLAGFPSGQREMKAVQPTFLNNLAATVNVLTAATEIGVERLVIAGSMEEPEPQEGLPVPVSPYAASKWASTSYARMFHKLYNTPVSIAKIFMVYGPGFQNCSNLIPYVINCLTQQKKPELTSGNRLVDWIFIDDVVEGLLQLGSAEGVEGKTIDLGSGKQLSVKGVCEQIKEIMDSNIELLFGALDDRPFEQIAVANLAYSRKYIDWKPQVGITEGLEKTISWFHVQSVKGTE